MMKRATFLTPTALATTVALTLALALAPFTPALGQQAAAPAHGPANMGEMANMDMSQMKHGMGGDAAMQSGPQEPGQSAFATIAEIVALLEADPQTDWSKISIDTLWAHLKDMDRVFTEASATTEATYDGARFIVTGPPEALDSIRRMVMAHSMVMQGVDGWHYKATPTDSGAIMQVSVPPEDEARLMALGFAGVMASGMHHQTHHWMLANGMNPHGN